MLVLRVSCLAQSFSQLHLIIQFHKNSFNLKEYKNETELSNEIWRIKNSGHHPKVKPETIKKCVPYSPQTKRCLLCLNKKLEIAAYEEPNLLNKRNEIVSKCWHQLKYALARFDTKDWDDVRLIETTIL